MDDHGSPATDGLRVNARVVIPAGEVEFRATRSGGPGGQHVNTSSTRVELTWNLLRSTALSDEERARVIARLGPRLEADGTLRVSASDTRSQRQNRLLAEERLTALVHHGLLVRKKRKATRPTRASVERRIDAKRKQGEKKRSRRLGGDD